MHLTHLCSRHVSLLGRRLGALLALAVAVALLSPAASAVVPGNESPALRTALDYVAAHRDDFGLSAADLEDVVVTDHYVSRGTGTTHIYLRQRLDGIEVYNGNINLNITRTGIVRNVNSTFVADLAGAVNTDQPRWSAVDAIERAAAELGLGAPAGLRLLEESTAADRRSVVSDGGISLASIPARLVYQPLADGSVRLAWDLEIQQRDGSHWWSVRVDAVTGELLDQTDYVDSEQYAVYPYPFESPQHSPTPPPADGRVIEVDPFMASPASPFGWHDDNGAAGAEFTITRGNNVHAYCDTDANNTPDGGGNAEPNGGAGLDFTGALVPLDLTMAPSAYRRAAMTNLFYWNNIIHDITWEHGFDEASGNFQTNNYGNGGVGNDSVQAEAQDGGGNCNANFGTPADGSRPRMQMFTCTNASPARDGDFDNGVIIHEYGHGVSNRLTGGPANAGCLGNTEQMGEGWSDYLAMMMTMEAGDLGPDARGMGTYLFGQAANGPGIRPAPYSTNTAVNSFTYANVGGVSIPHGVGFVWATMLWEMTWNLIDVYGMNPDLYDDWTTGGNNLAFRLVIDGMKIQPCGPGFVDGRDAILAADDILTGDGSEFSGANQCLIWDAFAARGLGWSASQGSPNSVTDGTPASDMPPFCQTVGAVPDSRNICQGDTASYLVGVGTDFTPPVTLSASGQPGGTTVTFTPNPVTGPLPTTATMEVTNTGAAAAGPYTITVTATDGTPPSHDADVALNVFAGVAVAPSLSSPADDAEDVSIQPTLTWTAAAGAVTYTVEIDDNPGFGSIEYSATELSGLSHAIDAELDYSETYYWRVRGENPCGEGSNSTVFSFTTEPSPAGCPAGFGAATVFTESFEGGVGGWTSSGTGNTWTLSGARTTSGVNAFFAVDPETTSDQRLVSPQIALPSGQSPLTLQYQNYQAFETPNTDGRCWDAGILEVSTNNGTSWSQVPAAAMITDPYDNIIWNNTPGNNPITNDYGATQAWCAETEPFRLSVVNIDTWAGQTVRFRWRLGSDGAAGNEGWYLDDVRVQGCETPLFSDGFESGDVSAWSNAVP